MSNITIVNRRVNISVANIPGNDNQILPITLANELPYQIFNRSGAITLTNRRINISVVNRR